MKNIKGIIFLLLIIHGFYSCYEDKIINESETILAKDHPPVNVSANVVGIIRDEFGNEIQGFTEKLQDKLYFSQNEGYYQFGLSDINKNGTPIYLYKDNVKYQFTLKPLGGEINYFSHTIFTHPLMVEKTANQNLEINLNDKINLTVNAGSYLNGNNDYTGKVIFKSFVPDLQNAAHLESLPGGHLAQDIDGNEVWLDIYQAFYFDMTTPDGKKLTIKKNKGKIVSQTDICDECIIWYFDPEKNIWQEYEMPEKTDMISFDFTKPGFYCIAKPYVYNLVEGRVKAGNKPLINQPVDIWMDNRLIQRVYTTNTGKWFAHLPMNKKYTLKIKPLCNNKFTTEFDLKEIDDTKLPAFDIGDNAIPFLNLNGEVRDCKNELLKNNFLLIWQGDKYQYLFIDDSQVDIDIIRCNTDKILVQIADGQWKNTGPRNIFIADNGIIDFERLYSCNEIKQDGYFNIKIDGKEKLFKATQAKLVSGRTRISVYDLENINMEMEIFFSGQEAREYGDNELNIYFDHLQIGENEYETNCINSKNGCGFNIFIIQYYGENKNDWIKGRFKGKFWLKNYNPLSASYKDIEAEFLVPRVF